MNNLVETYVKPIVDSTIGRASNLIGGTRQAVETSADWLVKGTTPVHILTNKGLKLNKISHNSLARLISTQAEMVEGTLVATAKRLEKAANANSVRELVDGQVALIPATRDRLTGDARKAIEILADTRDELTELANETVTEFSKRGKKATTQVRKTAKKTAKKTQKKATRARKKVARKVAPKKR